MTHQPGEDQEPEFSDEYLILHLVDLLTSRGELKKSCPVCLATINRTSTPVKASP